MGACVQFEKLFCILKLRRQLLLSFGLSIIYLFIIVGAGCTFNGDHTPRKAKNIILFIGDGMGKNHRQAAQWNAVGFHEQLVMDSMDYYGEVLTGSADSDVTDSAASATAIATGVKTNNGFVSLRPDHIPLTTILEEAKSIGKRVGIVTNTQVTHATPAAFAAHVEDRSQMTTIAIQMMENGLDVLIGGGEDEFLPMTEIGCYPESGERDDELNLIDAAVTSGYQYICDAEELNVLDFSTIDLLLGLFADEGLERPHSPSLAQMVQAAIGILAQGAAGFFLMVEAGQIDWAAHVGDAVHVIDDILALDAAVQVALAYPGIAATTLIIVTADHETGGMSLSTEALGLENEDGPFSMPGGGQFYINWSTTGHTSQKVPITASGPMADRLQGEFENTHVYEVMHKALD